MCLKILFVFVSIAFCAGTFLFCVFVLALIFVLSNCIH